MSRILVALFSSFCISATFGQTPSGSITGTVRNSDGAVTGATIQATNGATGTVYTAMTGRDGFVLAALPAGTYEVVVPPLGYSSERFVQSDVVVTAGQAVPIDIELLKTNLGVIGDDVAFLELRNRYAGLAGPAPRAADGRPDLSGVWFGNLDANPAKPVALPWAAALVAERVANDFRDAPEASCWPGPLLTAPILYKFVQAPSLLVQLIEGPGAYRQVFLDGRAHPDDLDPTWMGHSVGRWEGDTLVVDTVGFNGRGWLPDAYPHTEALHVVERYSRPDLARLNVDMTIEDPGAFTAPWELHMVWELLPGEELLEFVCNENNKYHENIAAE